MPVYSIKGKGEDRLLMLPAARALSFRFYHKNGKEQVRLDKAEGQLIAAVSGKVMVYKKPHAMQYHKEVMMSNSRALYLGLQCDTNLILANMLEYVETI